MITLLSHILPIALGFIAKLTALKAEDNKQRQELMIKALAAQNQSFDSARKYDTPASNASRRLLLWFLMFAISLSMLGYAVFDVPIYIEQVIKEPSYLFGLLGGGEHTEWIKIQGIPAFAELFQWMTVIIEMYFGATLARRA